MSVEEPAHGSPATVASLGTGLEAMRNHLAAVIAESQALRSEVKTAEAGRRRSTTIGLALMALLVALMVMAVIVTWQNNKVVREVDETNSRVADCTTPGGSCYQQANTRTGQAIADIIRAEIYMAECARLYPGAGGKQYDERLEACVYGRLAESEAARSGLSPSPSPSPSVDPR